MCTFQGRSQELEMGGGVQNFWARGLGAAKGPKGVAHAP